MRKIALLVLVCMMTLLIAGCVTPSEGFFSAPPTNVQQTGSCEISDFGNGILYFDCNFSTFALALSKYLEEHPDTKVCALDGPHGDFVAQGSWGTWVIINHC